MNSHKTIVKSTLSVLAAILLSAIMARGASAYEFIVMGDSRPLFVNAPQTMVFQRIIEEANLIRPDLIVNVGDLVYGYFAKSKEVEREYREFTGVISRLKIPFYGVVGNHDVAGENSVEAFQKYVGPLYRSFNHGGDHFVLLNTDQEGMDSGTPGIEQLKWLDNDLAQNATATNIYVFMHRPIFYDSTSENTSWRSMEQARMAEEIFLRHKVGYIFMGDAHIYSGFDRKGIHLYIAGGGGAETGAPQNNQFSHYLLVKVLNGRPEIKVIEPLHIWVNYEGRNDGTRDSIKLHVNVSQTDLYPMRLRGITANLRSLERHEKYVAVNARIRKVEPAEKGSLITLFAQMGDMGFGYREVVVKIVNKK